MQPPHVPQIFFSCFSFPCGTANLLSFWQRRTYGLTVLLPLLPLPQITGLANRNYCSKNENTAVATPRRERDSPCSCDSTDENEVQQDGVQDEDGWCRTFTWIGHLCTEGHRDASAQECHEALQSSSARRVRSTGSSYSTPSALFSSFRSSAPRSLLHPSVPVRLPCVARPFHSIHACLWGQFFVSSLFAGDCWSGNRTSRNHFS